MEFDFSDEKNDWLKENRGVSFEEVIDAIKNGGLIKEIKNPSKWHPDQQVLIVKMNAYIYAVPCVIDTQGRYFLKTIYASRKLVKKYLS